MGTDRSRQGDPTTPIRADTRVLHALQGRAGLCCPQHMNVTLTPGIVYAALALRRSGAFLRCLSASFPSGQHRGTAVPSTGRADRPLLDRFFRSRSSLLGSADRLWTPGQYRSGRRASVLMGADLPKMPSLTLDSADRLWTPGQYRSGRPSLSLDSADRLWTLL